MFMLFVEATLFHHVHSTQRPQKKGGGGKPGGVLDDMVLLLVEIRPKFVRYIIYIYDSSELAGYSIVNINLYIYPTNWWYTQ